MDTPLVLTIAEAAKLLSCCERTIRRAIKTGRIPHLRVYGRKVVVPRAALDRLLAGDIDTNGNGKHEDAAG